MDDKGLKEDLDELERKELLEKLLDRQRKSKKIKSYFEGLIKRYKEGGDLGDWLRTYYQSCGGCSRRS